MKLIKSKDLQIGDEFVRAVGQNKLLYGKVLGVPNDRRATIVYSYYKFQIGWEKQFFNTDIKKHNKKGYMDSNSWQEILLIKREDEK